MTKTDDRLVAEALAKVAAEVKPVEAGADARERHLAALTAAMAEPVRAPSRLPLVLALAAAALLAVGAGVFFSTRPAAPEVAVAPVVTAPELPAQAEPAELQNDTAVAMEVSAALGVRLELEAGARVVRPGETSARVLKGAVAAEVITGKEYRLESLDTSVTVRGGRARLTVGAGCDGRSRVDALAGAVEVSGEALPVGSQWPKCERAQAPAPAPAPPAKDKPTPQQSALERENALYLQALTLQRAGETRKAVALLDRVLENRASPLAEAALAHKLRWLGAIDPAAARAAATEYLQRFPRGFGRADAETLLLEKP